MKECNRCGYGKTHKKLKAYRRGTSMESALGMTLSHNQQNTRPSFYFLCEQCESHGKQLLRNRSQL